MQLDWEEAHSAALRECLKKRMSFSEAARTLNERFGTAYSRNAAIGRAPAHGAVLAQAGGPRRAAKAAKADRRSLAQTA
jgi:hypothetical protein